MSKRPALLFTAACLLSAGLLASTASQAQFGGGGGGGGGHGHGGRGGGQGGSGSPGNSGGPAPARDVPVDQIEIIGVITAIDAGTGRVTIQYQQTDALNLPAGVEPFEVAKTALLDGLVVGEKVRFRLESHQIAGIRPF